MRHLFSFSFWVLAIAICVFLPSASSADDWNRATTAIFYHPVQIPGGQVLPAGIYVFSLAEVSGERSIVQIWNADQTVLHATVHAWPDYLREAPRENRFVFEERGKGAPVLLKAWIYRGNSHVQTFIYPKAPIE